MTAVTDISCSWLGTQFMRLLGFWLLLGHRPRCVCVFVYSDSTCCRRLAFLWSVSYELSSHRALSESQSLP
jgi:hypothetical protein